MAPITEQTIPVSAPCGCRAHAGEGFTVEYACPEHARPDFWEDPTPEEIAADALADALHESLIDMDRDPIAYGRY